MKKDLVLDDLRKAKQELADKSDEELEEEHQSSILFKRIVNVLVASFLVLLMLSFLYLGSPVYSYIFGLAGSSRIDDFNTVVFRNEVIVSFDDETLFFLQELYNPLGDERAVCLLGEVKGNEYFVEGYYKPRVFERAWNYVSHAPCSDDTIIMLHTHPFKRCAPSSTDKNTLRNTKFVNPNIIMLVMCGAERFSAVID
ncbi:hypothetical protein KO361_00060 [Candidatus Woesearchaeota archaeon]|nr:hypothetical protein [Candidatus Woesearchaeota archaeon]